MLPRDILKNIFKSKHQNKIILVIDINTSSLKQISQIVLNAGFNLFKTSSGKEGLSLAKRYKPDLIIIDFQWLDIDKKEFCSQVKTTFAAKDTLILALKSLSSSDSVVESYELGVDNYLIKPVSKTLLLAEINRLLQEQSKYNSGQN